jgi:DNA-binding LytR/AlgR family response regulator
MKYNCIIVDDELPARKLLSDYVSKIDSLQLAGVCKNGLEAKQFLDESPVDILLLDIRMPMMTGIDLLKGLVTQPITIFITAYEEYAIKGFELDVIDYLVKPVPFDRFKKAIAKAIEYLEVLRPASEKVQPKDYFFIKTDTRIVKFMFSEISAIEAHGEYVKIIAANKKVMSLVSMTNIAKVLPDDFIRIHRSYIINLRQIDEVKANEVIIGKEIYPISRNHRAVFFDKLGEMKLL